MLNLQPYTDYPVCPACGRSRGHSEKLNIRYCSGAARDGRGQEDQCRFGGEPHLHVPCIWCSYEAAMLPANVVEPLTGPEVSALREMLAAFTTKG